MAYQFTITQATNAFTITTPQGTAINVGSTATTVSATQNGVLVIDNGYTGSQGTTGYTGSTGSQGATGNTGTSITVKASVASYSFLPIPGVKGNLYLVQDQGDLYYYNGSNYVDAGHIVGPTGYTGSAGAGGGIPFTISTTTNGFPEENWYLFTNNDAVEFRSLNVGFDGTVNIGGNLHLIGSGSNLIFPDYTVQTTAWTGTVSYNNITDIPPVITNQLSSSTGGTITLNGGSVPNLELSSSTYITFDSPDANNESLLLGILTAGLEDTNTSSFLLSYNAPFHIGVDSNRWYYNQNGSITFPDNTVQTTAFTGQIGDQALYTTSSVTFDSVTATNVIQASQFRASVGASYTTGYSFYTETDQSTGVYSEVEGQVSIYGYENPIATFNTSTVQLYQPLQVNTATIQTVNIGGITVSTATDSLVLSYTSRGDSVTNSGLDLLLMNFNDPSTPYNDIVALPLFLNGSGTFSNAQTKFGAYSYYNNDPSPSNFIDSYHQAPIHFEQLNSTDWTIDFWMYIDSATANGSGNQTFVNGSDFGQGPGEIWFGIDNGVNSGNGTLRCGPGGSNNNPSSYNPPIDQWLHIGLMRKAGSYYYLCNGVTEAISGDASLEWPQDIELFGGERDNAWSAGYIANMRIANQALFDLGTYTLPVSTDYDPAGSTLIGGGGGTVVKGIQVSTATVEAIKFADNTIQTTAWTTATLGDIRFNGSWIRNKDTGNIYISPQDGQTWVNLPGDNQASGNPIQIANVAGGGIQIYDGTGSYTFNTNGLTFPNSTVQTTAYSTASIKTTTATITTLALTSASTVVTLPAEGLLILDGATDSSTFAHTLTFTGGATTYSGINDPWLTETPTLFINGGNVSVPYDVDFNFGSDNFTIDFWFYALDDGTYSPLGNWNGSSGLLFNAVGSGGQQIIYFYGPGPAWQINTPAFNPNEWHHIAVSRNSGVVTIWLDGVAGQTYNSDVSFVAEAPLNIGSAGGGPAFNGYMTGVRIVDYIALWSNTFTPPVPNNGDYALHTYTTGGVTNASITFPDNTVQTTAAQSFDQSLNTTDNPSFAELTAGGVQLRTSVDANNTNAVRVVNVVGNPFIIENTGDRTAIQSHDPGNYNNSAEFSVDSQNATIYVIQDGVAQSRWLFNAAGAITFPNQSTNNRTGSGDALVFARDGAGQKIIATQSGDNSYSTVERLVIAGGDGYASGEGGDIYLWAGKSGPTGGTGGDIKVDAGDAYDSQGGTVKIRGGNVYNGDNSIPGEGGFIQILAGHSYNGGTGGTITLAAGNGYNGGVNGKVIIQSATGNWQFNSDGSITFPDNTVQTSAMANGYTGSQGDIGYQGSQGDVGYIGSQGDLGYTGSQGDIGYVGSQGDQGIPGNDGGQGPQGDPGYVGSQGDIGYVGSQGDVGYVGSQGDLGYTGSQGDIGYIGSQGDIGYTGSAGVDGYIGSQGDIGYVGSKGDIGYVGSVGIGYVGSAGTNGTNGYTGSAGTNGTNGYTGSAGTNGTNGYTGSQGSIGYVGSAGTNGTNGTNGGYTGIETVYVGGSTSGTITPAISSGTVHTYTLTGNITLNALASPTTGSSVTLIMTQDATGGRTLTSTMKWAGGNKTLSTAATATDVVSVFYDGTNYYAALNKGWI